MKEEKQILTPRSAQLVKEFFSGALIPLQLQKVFEDLLISTQGHEVLLFSKNQIIMCPRKTWI